MTIEIDVKEPEVKELEAALQRGEIPDIIRESAGLIPEDTEVAQEFQAYMVDLAVQLLTDAGISFNRTEISKTRFMLSDNPRPNAGLFSLAEPRIVYFTKGMWEILQSLDQVESVTAHELGHEKARERIGEIRVSEGEEIFADMFEIYVLEKAGRRISAAREVQSLLIENLTAKEKKQGVLSYFLKIFMDPHPVNEIRVRYFEDTHEVLKENKGLLEDKEGRPIPEAVKKRFSEFKSKNSIERILDQEGFYAMEIAEQVEWVCDHMAIAVGWKEIGYEHRYSEFAEFLEIFSKDLKQEIIESKVGRPQLKALEDKLLDVTAKSTDLIFYDKVRSSAIEIDDEPTTVTRDAQIILDLREATGAFVNASSVEEAESSAEKIIKLATNFDLKNDEILSNPDIIPAFLLEKEVDIMLAVVETTNKYLKAVEKGIEDDTELNLKLAKKYGVEVPWNKQIGFLQESGSKNIEEALRLMGVLDPRMPELTIAEEDLDLDPDMTYRASMSRNGHPLYSNAAMCFPNITKPTRLEVTREFYGDGLEKVTPHLQELQRTRDVEATKTLSSTEISLNGYFYSYGNTMVNSSTFDVKFDYSALANMSKNDVYQTLMHSISDSRSDPAIKNEKRRLAVWHFKQKRALENASFDELENDFWGFVNKHKKHLLPEASFLKAQEPFQQKFIVELKRLIQEQPEKFRPLAYEFFVSRDSITNEVIIQNDPKGRITMIARFDEVREYEQNTFIMSKDESEMVVGVGFHNPLISFILSDEFELFPDTASKLIALEKTRFLFDKGYEFKKHAGESIAPEILKVYGVDSKNLSAELVLKNVRGTYNNWIKDKDKYSNYHVSLTDDRSKFSGEKREDGSEEEFIFIEPDARMRLIIEIPLIIQVIESSIAAFSPEDTKMFFEYAAFAQENYFFDDSRLKTALGKLVEKNKSRDLSSRVSAEELISNYDTYMGMKVLKDKLELRISYQDRIMQRIGEIENPRRVAEIVESFLANHANDRVVYKEFLTDTWHKAQIAIWEEEKGNMSISKFSRSVADRIVPNTAPIAVGEYDDKGYPNINLFEAFNLLQDFAENLELQADDCFYIRDRLKDAGFHNLPQNDSKLKAMEFFFVTIASKADSQMAMLEYLSEPDSKRGRQRVVEAIKKSYLHHSLFRIASDEPAMENELNKIHENYCSWELGFQGLFLGYLLFPIEVEETSRSEWNKPDFKKKDEIQDMVLKKAFPQDKLGSKMSVDFFKALLAQHTSQGQRILYSIIMASTRKPEQEAGKVSDLKKLGRNAAEMLGKMHPLGTILVQELESFAGIHPEIRNGIRDVDVKSDVALGARWDTIERMQHVTAEKPETLLGRLIGKVLGGGSAQLAIQLKSLISGGDDSVSIKRKYAIERAERQYYIFKAAFGDFVSSYPQFQEVESVLEASMEKLRLELDYRNTKVQHKHSAEACNNVRIKYGSDIIIEHSKVKLKSHGENFRIYDMADGGHFNDLPPNHENIKATPEQVRIKKAWALANIAAGLSPLLRGMPVNSDLHGKQQKGIIETLDDGTTLIKVRHFDDGAVAIEQPNEDQKRALGRLLGLTIKAVLKDRKTMMSALVEASSEFVGTDQELFILTQKRALRNILGDNANARYVSQYGLNTKLVSGSDVKDVITALHIAGHTETIIRESMVEAAGQNIFGARFKLATRNSQGSTPEAGEGYELAIPERVGKLNELATGLLQNPIAHQIMKSLHVPNIQVSR